MDVQSTNVSTEQMLSRICGEYSEMPGLQLTAIQARRLWGLDERTCNWLLAFLVETRFLSRNRRGMYARLVEGAVPPISRGVVKAEIVPTGHRDHEFLTADTPVTAAGYNNDGLLVEELENPVHGRLAGSRSPMRVSGNANAPADT
jgi:hypothetical protein